MDPGRESVSVHAGTKGNQGLTTQQPFGSERPDAAKNWLRVGGPVAFDWLPTGDSLRLRHPRGEATPVILEVFVNLNRPTSSTFLPPRTPRSNLADDGSVEKRIRENTTTGLPD